MAAGQKPPALGATPSRISISDFIKNFKTYDCNMQESRAYDAEDINFSLKQFNGLSDREKGKLATKIIKQKTLLRIPWIHTEKDRRPNSLEHLLQIK